VEDLVGDALGGQAVAHGLGHPPRRLPHGVVEDHGGLFRHLGGPLLVPRDDLQGVRAPDHAVARGDHVHGQAQAHHLVDLLRDERAEGREDVGVVLQGLLVELLLVDLVVEPERRRVVLAEGVVGHEQVFPRQVGEHAVGPVEHGGLDEHELALADGDAVARLDGPEFPGMVMDSLDALRPPLGDDEFGVGRVLHDEREPSRVVGLGMVGDDDVDLGRVDDGPDVLEPLLLEGGPGRVYQDGLLVPDEVGIVGGAPVRRKLVAVKLPQAPVDDPHPVDVLHQLRDHTALPVRQSFIPIDHFTHPRP